MTTDQQIEPIRLPTQIVYPVRAALRTAAQTLIALAGFLAVAMPIVLPFLGQYLPPAWLAWLVGGVAFIVALAGIVARIMALPQAQAFLTAIGLGAVPKHRA